MGAPKGFQRVETTVSGFWKPATKGQFIQGVVGRPVSTAGQNGKPNSFYLVRLTVDNCGPVYSKQGDGEGEAIKTKAGMLVGVGGAALVDFLNENQGREVYLEYEATNNLGGGKRIKRFQTFVSNESA